MLTACQKHGLRPLILLNSNGGSPCPSHSFGVTLAADANIGDRTILIEKTSQVRLGYTGLVRQAYQTAFPFVTSVDANTGRCTLSRPGESR